MPRVQWAPRRHPSSKRRSTSGQPATVLVPASDQIAHHDAESPGLDGIPVLSSLDAARPSPIAHPDPAAASVDRSRVAPAPLRRASVRIYPAGTRDAGEDRDRWWARGRNPQGLATSCASPRFGLELRGRQASRPAGRAPLVSNGEEREVPRVGPGDSEPHEHPWNSRRHGRRVAGAGRPRSPADWLGRLAMTLEDPRLNSSMMYQRGGCFGST